MTVRCGDTLLFQTLPVIAAGAAVGGKKESEGPLAAEFDELSADNRFGQSSWEAAEKYLQLRAARLCLQRRRFRRKRCSWPLPGICRPSARHPAMPCGSWACPLPGCSGPAAPWPRALRWALLCARAVLRAICWPWLPATFCAARAAVPHAAELRRGAHVHGPSGLPPLPDAAFCSRRAKALALPLPPLAVCRIIR